MDQSLPAGISIDPENPKYRLFKSDDGILEYTFRNNEITVDWVSGFGAATMIRSILDAEGEGVVKIAGYVTDRLGEATDDVLKRFCRQVISKLDDGWKSSINRIDGRRYLEFTK